MKTTTDEMLDQVDDIEVEAEDVETEEIDLVDDDGGTDDEERPDMGDEDDEQ